MGVLKLEGPALGFVSISLSAAAVALPLPFGGPYFMDLSFKELREDVDACFDSGLGFPAALGVGLTILDAGAGFFRADFGFSTTFFLLDSSSEA